MRLKIWCDGESYKILEFWSQLNKRVVLNWHHGNPLDFYIIVTWFIHTGY
jgi:hypothetical protein